MQHSIGLYVPWLTPKYERDTLFAAGFAVKSKRQNLVKVDSMAKGLSKMPRSSWKVPSLLQPILRPYVAAIFLVTFQLAGVGGRRRNRLCIPGQLMVE